MGNNTTSKKSRKAGVYIMAITRIGEEDSWFDELIQLRKQRLELIAWMLEKKTYDALPALTLIEKKMCRIATGRV